ncbi:MAG: hypothetical protein FJ319_11515 [SAR202 cluster bacterium]|nr:hypothetical protein [SAR202 cluster bacterium]
MVNLAAENPHRNGSDIAHTVCVILAGGKGTRMASKDRHKACFPIGGIPAIVRAIDTYKKAGLRRFIVVVGQMADQVMSTVAPSHPDVTFVYQANPRGTGHATSIAAEALAAQGYQGNVIVLMGDKVTRPEVIRRFHYQFVHSHTDLMVTTVPPKPQTTGGRVIVDETGAALGIVELADIRRAEQFGAKIHVGNIDLTAAEVEQRSVGINASMYGYRFSALQDALRHLKSDNAQAEVYITDTVQYLAARGRVAVNRIQDPTDLMSFDTPADLLAIEEVVSKRERPAPVAVALEESLGPRAYKSIRQWIEALTANGPGLAEEMRDTYGPDVAFHEDRRRAMLALLEHAAKSMGLERRVILCRAPGRVNLMGRHVDHRGGYVNVMAISREVLMVAAPRSDDTVTITNTDRERFPDREFRISDLLYEASWSDWMDFMDSRTVRQVLDAAPGDWSHYARAPLLRLQYKYSGLRVKGMDCVVTGNIPMAAGLSSSSALVVAFAEAAVALNGLSVGMRDFVDLCGQGEWFVGSRGGSADHAAIRTSKVGNVSRIGFFPFRIEGETPFPDELKLVIVYSGQQAQKTVGARDIFNQRVACYQIAERLLRHTWPAAAAMQHLRDIVPDRLGVAAADVYRALARLPDNVTRDQVRELMPEKYRPDLDKIFSSHKDQGEYDIRGVALYGIAECMRSDRFSALLREGDKQAIGRLMKLSHDGDRVWSCPPGKAPAPFRLNTDDATLARLAQSNADLVSQPGRYACSTKTIDGLVDLANTVEGVIGAQLSGAGLGGCMMILVRANAMDRLMSTLRASAQDPDKFMSGVYVCQPVAGAGLIKA